MSRSFQWSTAFDVGVDSMNLEHQGLFERMQKVSDLCEMSTSKENILSAYDSLISYTEKHFAHEEDLMVSLNYKGLEAHRRLHKELLDKLHKYRKELVNSVYAALPSSVFDFFENWLLTHILIVDKQYGDEIKDSEG